MVVQLINILGQTIVKTQPNLNLINIFVEINFVSTNKPQLKK